MGVGLIAPSSIKGAPLLSLVLALSLSTSCAHAPGGSGGDGRAALPKADRNGQPVTDTGPPPAAPAKGTVYEAVASWYGPGFNGRRTASGDVFDQDGLTAAHRTYPFGTRLKVTNPKNDKACTVVVNDRGPFVAGVDIDISRGASRAISRLDTGPVLIEELDRDMSYVREVRTGAVGGSGYYRVQVGSFVDPDNAEHLRRSIEFERRDVRITKAEVGGKTFHRVQVGRFTGRRTAYQAASALADEGYATWIVRDER